jgi:hypothetical protein
MPMMRCNLLKQPTPNNNDCIPVKMDARKAQIMPLFGQTYSQSQMVSHYLKHTHDPLNIHRNFLFDFITDHFQGPGLLFLAAGYMCNRVSISFCIYNLAADRQWAMGAQIPVGGYCNRVY